VEIHCQKNRRTSYVLIQIFLSWRIVQGARIKFFKYSYTALPQKAWPQLVLHSFFLFICNQAFLNCKQSKCFLLIFVKPPYYTLCCFSFITFCALWNNVQNWINSTIFSTNSEVYYSALLDDGHRIRKPGQLFCCINLMPRLLLPLYLTISCRRACIWHSRAFKKKFHSGVH